MTDTAIYNERARELARARYVRNRESIKQQAREYRKAKLNGTWINKRDIRLDEIRIMVNALSDGECGYLAGIIDGEGSILLTRSRALNKYGSATQYYAAITIVNTNLPMLTWVKERLGGSIMETGKGAEHYKDVWRWQMQGQRASVICNKLLPWLIIKRPRAALAIELYVQGFSTDARRVSELELHRRESIWRRAHERD